MIETSNKNRIDLYFLQTARYNYQELSPLTSMLTPQELSRFEKSKSRDRRVEFLLGRVLIKTILSEQLDLSQADIFIELNEHGKPYLRREKEVEYTGDPHFNLSHCEGIIVLAVTEKHPIGVDIEKVEPNLMEIATSLFSEPEIQYLSGLPQEKQDKEACRLWTLKEAFIKAKGKGLIIPMDSFNVLNNKELLLFTTEPEYDTLLGIAQDISPTEKVETVRIDLTIETLLSRLKLQNLFL